MCLSVIKLKSQSKVRSDVRTGSSNWRQIISLCFAWMYGHGVIDVVLSVTWPPLLKVLRMGIKGRDGEGVFEDAVKRIL